MNRTVFFRGIICAYVLLVYAVYLKGHLLLNAPQSVYQYLTEGFLSGHLHLLVSPPAELLHLQDPYDPAQNAHIPFLWDVSLFKDKYYLYFGPLPVVAFYLPFKWLTGFYPSDSLVAFFFLSVGFLVSFYLLIKIKKDYFPQLPELQLLFAGFLLGFADGSLYLLARPLMYEVAVSSAFCLMSFAIFFLYELLNQRSKIKNAILFSVCLALSVAGRPHFVLPCLVLIPLVAVYFIKHNAAWTGFSRGYLIGALLIPCLCVGAMLGAYNYLRFGSIVDFGHVWQLNEADLRVFHAKLLEPGKILRNALFGFYFYFLQLYDLTAKFPYVMLHYHLGSIPIDKDYLVESIGGVFTTVPFIFILAAMPKLVYANLKQKSPDTPLYWYLLFVFLIPLILVLFLLSLPIATQRYEVDFLPWFVMLSIISFWLLQKESMQSKRFKFVRVLFFTAGVYSMYLGFAFAIAYVIAIVEHNKTLGLMALS